MKKGALIPPDNSKLRKLFDIQTGPPPVGNALCPIPTYCCG